MATVTKTWTFDSDAEGLVENGNSANITFAYEGSDGSPNSGCVKFTTTTPSISQTEYGLKSTTTDTWETWGVPAGATVSSVKLTAWKEKKEAIKRHQAEYKRLQDRIHAMYVDKLDGVVDTAFYDKMSNQWREEQNRCQREIDRLQEADKSYLDEGVQILELARNAQSSSRARNRAKKGGCSTCGGRK